ncbi:MAG: bifunctional riboflavin kinase/FAD synthetase [Acidobacteriota bacterium]
MSRPTAARVIHDPTGVDNNLPSPVATIGNFDGVHRGHQKILETLQDRARALDGTTVVITFNPHPQKVLHPDSAPRLIDTPAQKHRRLASAGADVIYELPFTRALAALTPDEFVQQTLLRPLRVREVWIGRNFRFGHGRTGDFETLETLGRAHGFSARPVDGVRHSGIRISSSRVRESLAAGDIETARALLGHHPELIGRVYRGDGRGHDLGFPTANLNIENELLPLTGVYATLLQDGDISRPSVTNIGSRPTFPGAGAAVEAHVLDFDADLYDRTVALQFVARLRDEKRFADLAALKAQIVLDTRKAREMLS